MSARALLWALGQSPGSPAEKMILIAIADAVDDDGICEIGFMEISAFTGGSLKEIEKLVGRLIEAGFVVDTVHGVNGIRMRLPLEIETIDPPRKRGRRRAQEMDSRGSRLREDWEPSDADRAFARERGLSETEIAHQVMTFRNFWVAKSGKDAVKMRWDLTWRNWILNALNTKGGRGGRGPSGGGRRAYSC